MKVTVDVDCTPEEARRFLGLPDLTPAHAVYVERMQKMMADGLSPDSVAEMMKAWGPMGDAGLGLWKQMVDQMSGKK
jgi:hypothetical protein